MSPARRRAAVHYLVRRHKVSERRACKVIGQHRSTQRYEGVPGDYELKLVKRMNELADAHPRYGYRMVWALLRSEGWAINRKRIERLWRLEGHRVPPKRTKKGKKAGGHDGNAIWNLPATRPNHIWSYDFMGDRLRDGTALRIFNVVDEYTRVGLASHVDRSIGAAEVIVQPDHLFRTKGKPEYIRSDNGREFIAASVGEWLDERGVKTAFVEKGSPQQNAFVERFNGTMRDEVLNREEFDTLAEADVVVNRWRNEYNRHRPHRGLGFKTPFAFADEARKEIARERAKGTE
ncbi:MAG TPA: IS3 family transposase [Actinomycetota bacterium]